ncbi:MAG: hypothetical protein ABIH66_00880 [bacterium]
MPGECHDRMKRFFEESDIGHGTAAPLRQKAVAFAEFEGDVEKYELVKLGKRCVLRPRKSKKAEVLFRFSKGSIDHLFEPPPESVHDFINRFFDCLIEKAPSKKAVVKLLTSIFDGWRKGYINMLLQGGGRAIPTMSKVGINIPLKLLR